MYTYILSFLDLLPSPSHPHPTCSSPQSTEPVSLDYRAASRQLFILHTVVYICQSQPPSSAHSPLPPPLCAHVHSLDLESVIQSEVSQKENTQTSYINTYIWKLEKRYRWIYLQGSNRDKKALAHSFFFTFTLSFKKI